MENTILSGSQSNLERRVLSACLLSRGNYEQVKGVDRASFSAIAQVVSRLLEEYYVSDGDAGHCDKQVLVDRARQSAGNPKHAEQIANYVEGLDLGVSVPNLLLDVRKLKRGKVGDRLASLLANRQDGHEVDALVDEYIALGDESVESVASDEELFAGIPVTELIQRNFHDRTLPFGLKVLDKLCSGGARPGHHVLVFARPEIGKTLFTLDLVARQLQSGHSVLYVGNEDPMGDIVLRLVGRIGGLSRNEILGDPERANEVAFGRGYGNFVGASLAPGKLTDISRILEEYPSDVLVIDQLRNLDVEDDNRVTALEKAAIGIRNLAKRHGVVALSVTQAGESAEGRSALEFSRDIDFSKTGIPGAIDLAIGIGATDEDKRHGFRTVNISKNKLGGIHDSFQIRIDTKTGLVQEIG